MADKNTPLTWLDIIDEALCELPSQAFSEIVAQAQSFLQDVLNGQVPVEQLLSHIDPHHGSE